MDAVVDIYREASDFSALVEKRDYIKKVVALEEDRFQATLAQGCDMLSEHIAALQAAGKKELSGDDAFKLYDTFGFPWELTEEILHENGLTLDQPGFETAMQIGRAHV